MRILPPCFLAAFLATPVIAQDRPDTILVMDGSGSMWGQIDGVAKITIAQDVVTDLLSTIPETQGLGLTVYGHRERGNCTDIETIVPPAPGSAQAIADAVAGISPLGKTPMTDAIVTAAEALRYTENSATVILISDGVETCNPDPCAAAQTLEETGVDFTAHVIGFDISDPETLSQMQCIADATGGKFLTAANAAQLNEALTEVASEPPATISATFEVRIGSDTGPLLSAPIFWDIGDVAHDLGNPLTVDLVAGSYDVTASLASVTNPEYTNETKITATIHPNDAQTIVVVFPETIVIATLAAPDTAVAGSTISVDWTGPRHEADHIITTEPGNSRALTFTKVSNGNPAHLRMPPTEGTYEIRYLLREGRNEVLATQLINVTPALATIDAPTEGVIGDTITVAWAGPDYEGDMIIMADPNGSSNISPKPTRNGNPVEMTLPSEPGSYEIRYRMQQGSTIIATHVIDVTEIKATLIAPETAIAGETITVGWDGPDYDLDFIAVGTPGDSGYINYTYTRDGDPLELEMPPEPGDYEIRYTLRQDNQVLATHPITITKADVNLTAPDTAVAGETIMVDWVGPDYDLDFIAIGEPGDDGYINYSYTRDGTPLGLEMPTEPGDYEIRYTLRQDSEVLARRMITITEPQVSLTAPDSAVAGSTVMVEWMGPRYELDFIAIGTPGDSGYENYTYTRDGNPLGLEMPTEPGTYEIRYTLRQDNKVLISQPIEITPAKATVTAPDTANVGETLMLDWDGPDYDLDFLSVGPVGDTQYDNYSYTRDGTPLELEMPAEPGEYEIRYQLRQNSAIITRHPITINAIKAQLVGPDSVALGEELIVGWDGPDYDQDFIAISIPGETGYETYTYTRDGNPLTLRLPDEPGAYELRYFMRQDNTVIGSKPITITK